MQGAPSPAVGCQPTQLSTADTCSRWPEWTAEEGVTLFAVPSSTLRPPGWGSRTRRGQDGRGKGQRAGPAGRPDPGSAPLRLLRLYPSICDRPVPPPMWTEGLALGTEVADGRHCHGAQSPGAQTDRAQPEASLPPSGPFLSRSCSSGYRSQTRVHQLDTGSWASKILMVTSGRRHWLWLWG